MRVPLINIYFKGIMLILGMLIFFNKLCLLNYVTFIISREIKIIEHGS
jgi:hypothetical protein